MFKDKLKNPEKCLFLVPMRPIKKFLFVTWTSTSDPEAIVPATIDESRYKVKDNYKITLKSLYDAFGSEHFYIRDLESLIKNGHVKFYKEIEK